MLNEENPPSNQPIESTNSGSYDPGPINESDLPTAELSVVQAHTLDLAVEEFPEGPYGAATNEEKLGKVSEWKEDQAYSPRYRDANPVGTDRTVPVNEPKSKEEPLGSIEGQN